ncbi:MAG TPA: hypothetical protein VHO50_13810 [Bacteroidales bacterium]|nr:hypothetical protein [Bacteroidales bacterium]
MRKRTRNIKGNTDHRGNTKDLARDFKLKMNVVNRIPPVFYSSDGEVKHAGKELKK